MTTMTISDEVKAIIRDIPDFPKKGIVFKDITPLLRHPATFRKAVDALAAELRHKKIDYIAGVESRGFIFSPILAYHLNAGFIPVRKQGKLPYRTEQIAYELEYGDAILEIHQDAVEPGSKVVIVDDLLATGGTALAAIRLIERLGGRVVGLSFLVELAFLQGRDRLRGYDVFSLVQY